MEAYSRLVLNQINTVFSKYTILYNYKESNVCYNLVYVFVLFFCNIGWFKKVISFTGSLRDCWNFPQSLNGNFHLGNRFFQW